MILDPPDLVDDLDRELLPGAPAVADPHHREVAVPHHLQGHKYRDSIREYWISSIQYFE